MSHEVTIIIKQEYNHIGKPTMILICTNYFVIFSCLVNRVELLTKYICNDELNFWISFPVHYFDVSMLITCLLELIKLDHILSTIFIIIKWVLVYQQKLLLWFNSQYETTVYKPLVTTIINILVLCSSSRAWLN